MVEDLPERNVCAIVVTYHPDIAVLGDLLSATRPQVGSLVVVDNGSPGHIVSWLQARADAASIVLIPLPQNLGLGAAHNRGIGWARQHGFSHVLLMDQDSIPMPGMVRKLLMAVSNLSQKGGKVAAGGPRWVDIRTSREAPFVKFGLIRDQHSYCAGRPDEACIPADFLISSGTLIPIAVIDDIGGMEESLFVDNIDMEWCFRAAGAGYQLYGVCDAVMAHHLGDAIITLWFVGWRNYARHSPIRLYYIMRNRVLLYAKSYTPGKWIFRDIFRLTGKLLLYGVLLPPRLENGRMMLEGLWHGLIGRSGKYADEDSM